VSAASGATVAVTGATGTIGIPLVRLLEADERVGRVVAIARRPFDGATHGWRHAEQRRVDVRDRSALTAALAGADAVVHLAFSLPGVRQGPGTLRDVNVEGTLNALAAARASGARRFVQASSAAVYGFPPRGEQPLREDAPVTEPGGAHFYVDHKVEVERRLRRELDRDAGGLEATFVRPVGVAGPHAAGAAGHGLPRLARAGVQLAQALYRAGVRPPLPPLPVPVQLVHERDAADAFRRAALGDGPPGTYNVGGEGVVTGAEFVRGLGFPVLPLPERAARAGARALDALPKPWPVAMWVHILTAPVVVDASAARERLGWAPRHTTRDALAAMVPALAGRAAPGG
jgi:nucleoside-diphosphate-sugar epimerase